MYGFWECDEEMDVLLVWNLNFGLKCKGDYVNSVFVEWLKLFFFSVIVRC